MKIQGIQNQTSFNGVVNISENLSPKMRNEISKSLKNIEWFSVSNTSIQVPLLDILATKSTIKGTVTVDVKSMSLYITTNSEPISHNAFCLVLLS